MIGVGVELVRMERQVGVRARASLILVLVAMRVRMSAAVTVRVGVHCVGVVVVNGPVRVGNIRVILMPHIRVIAMVVVEMISVGYIPVVLVRGGFVLVVVIAVLNIPEVPVRWLLRRGIQMAGTGAVGMIRVRG
jgi:hypothetical protein